MSNYGVWSIVAVGVGALYLWYAAIIARRLASGAFSLAAFLDSGLVEPFESAAVRHILTGDAYGVPFALAEISLHDAKGYRMFGGVLASFRLSRPRPGLTKRP